MAPTPSEVVHQRKQVESAALRRPPRGSQYSSAPSSWFPRSSTATTCSIWRRTRAWWPISSSRGTTSSSSTGATPGSEDKYLTLEDIADRYIGRATRVAARLAGVSTGASARLLHGRHSHHDAHCATPRARRTHVAIAPPQLRRRHAEHLDPHARTLTWAP